VAAVLTTVSILLAVLLPFTIILAIAGVELTGMVVDVRTNREQFDEQIDGLREKFQLQLPKPIDEFDQLMATLFDQAASADWKGLNDSTEAVRAWLDRASNQLAGDMPVDTRLALWTLEALQRNLRDLETAEPRSETWHSAYDAVRKEYYSLRGRLVQVYYLDTEGNHAGRFRTWMVLHANPTRQQVDELRGQLLDFLGLASLGGLAVSTGTAVGKALIGFIFGMIVMTIAIYYFLADGPEMVESVMRLSPLDRKHVSQLLGEFDKVSRAVVMATLLSALAQAALGGIGYWLAGFDSIFLLTVLTLVLAMIPFVGAAAVWAPCCLWLLLVEQRMAAAIVLAIYGVAVISAVDNLIKPYVLHGQSNLHPLLALLSVLGGVQALGPIGIFVGPMAVAFLQALLHMLQSELKDIDKAPQTGGAPSAQVKTG
jgi:predicted PurR-regulated permease PerM